MSKRELAEQFARNMETERIHLKLSQAEMAKRLDMSLSTYKNILNGVSYTIPMYSAYRLYELSGQLLISYIYNDSEKEMLDMWRKLEPTQKICIRKILEYETR